MGQLFLFISFLFLVACNSNFGLFQAKLKWRYPTARSTTLKNLHADYVNLSDTLVITDGIVETLGPNNTYFVITDSKAKVIVTNQNLATASSKMVEKGLTVRVLGRLKGYNKGYVALQAEDLAVVKK